MRADQRRDDAAALVHRLGAGRAVSQALRVAVRRDSASHGDTAASSASALSPRGSLDAAIASGPAAESSTSSTRLGAQSRRAASISKRCSAAGLRCRFSAQADVGEPLPGLGHAAVGAAFRDSRVRRRDALLPRRAAGARRLGAAT